MIAERTLIGLMLLAVLASASDAVWATQNKHHKAKRDKPAWVETYAGRPEVRLFAQDLAKHGLDAAYVEAVLRQARKLESVRKVIKPLPAGARKNWQGYRARFVDEEHIRAGARFWQDNEAALSEAAKLYGVPEAVILGILGVETEFGRNSGRYRVLDTLATLAFDYPQGDKDRAPYFRDELAAFFLWCARSQCAPLSVRGSYAGAIGMAQFMPENIERYGVDFDGDGRINLQDPVDAIGSVARFLALHGWVRHLAPCFAVNLEGAARETLLAPDIVPSFFDAQLEALGARPIAPLPPMEKFALVELQNRGAPSAYFLASQNFFVLTRYNRSAYYAKAVLELGQAIAAARMEMTEEIVAQGRQAQTPAENP